MVAQCDGLARQWAFNSNVSTAGTASLGKGTIILCYDNRGAVIYAGVIDNMCAGQGRGRWKMYEWLRVR